MTKRIFGAILICIVIIPFLVVGGMPFAILMATLGVAAMYELLKLKDTKRITPNCLKIITYVATACIILNNFQETNIVLSLNYTIIAILILLFFMPILLIDNNEKYNLSDAIFLFGSSLFIGLSFNLIMLIRNYSFVYVIYLLLITTSTDIFALVTGSLIGKHKLDSSFSPKKTIEGLIGGTIMATILGMMFYFEGINPNASFLNIMIVTITLSLIGQFGDLIFSSIKRFYNTKDFSNLIPGHGGILDRFDSIIFVVYAATLFLEII